MVRRFISTQLLSVYAESLLRAYTGAYWFLGRDNFNSVINSGALLAALAVLDEPDTFSYGTVGSFAKDALQVALLALPHGARSIYDDGSYPEGPGYGVFAISHHLAAVRALESALGSTYGLDVAGLANACRWLVDMGATGATPSGLSFNWADGGTGQGTWITASLARRYACCARDVPLQTLALQNALKESSPRYAFAHGPSRDGEAGKKSVFRGVHISAL